MEFRYAEIRADGRQLSGVAVKYGDTAKLPFGLERFEPGAFGRVQDADIILNVQHRRDRPLARSGGGGLLLTDSQRELAIAATLPSTRESDDALELVRTGVLRGLSIEFTARRDRKDNGVRVVEKAELSGVGLVDRPAYRESSVEAREEFRLDGRGLSGAIFYDMDTVISDTESIRKERYSPGAFDFAIEDGTREINLIMGRSYDRPLASRRAGSLQLEDGPDALRFNVDTLPETSYVNDFRSQVAAGSASFGVTPLFSIPPPETVPDAVTIIPEPGSTNGAQIRVVRQAVLQGIAVVARAPRGNPGEVAQRSKLWLLV